MTQHIRYLTLLVGSSTTLCLVIFCINVFFDPLWYITGNQLEDLNYMFNERLSKTNQFIKQRSSQAYNCIIFGSSRTILLDESRLEAPYRCYNFSFSGGRIQEFVAFAKWLKKRGEQPEYVILGIDDFNFVELATELNIPKFVTHHSDPPSIFYSYFSLDALDMSSRLFFHSKNDTARYNQVFRGTVREDPPKYHPTLLNYQQTLRQNVVSDYKELRNVFPQSIFMAYIPPVSSWITASKSQEEIDFFLHSVYRISSFFHKIYDFSIPSEITNNPENTWDGSHYLPVIQNEIVRRLNGEPLDFGVSVTTLSEETYIENFRTKVREFQATLNKS